MVETEPTEAGNPAHEPPIKSRNGSAIDDSEHYHERVRDVHFEVVGTSGRRREGRPTKLTEARFKRILENIRSGLTSVRAVRVEGIVYTTWRSHIQRKPEWAKLVDAAEEVREEVWRSEALEAVKAAFPKHWVAAMTFLERRYPAEFSLRNVVRTESGERGHYEGLTREQVIALLEAAQTVESERPKGLELPPPAAEENRTPCSLSPRES